MRFRLPDAEPATLRIFSMDGRQIWSRRLETQDAGWRELHWDGTDGRGRPAASGLYFAHLRQGERYAALRLTLFR